MQVEVHGAQPDHAVHHVLSSQGVELEELLLFYVQIESLPVGKIVVGSQEKAACAAGRIVDGLAWLGAHHFHHGPDERPGSEVLARAALHVLGVLLQQPFVDFAL